MANDKPKLTQQDIEQLKRRIDPDTGEPYTEAKIAEIHNVSPQYVNKLKRTGVYYKTHRQRAMEHFPWTVPAEFANASPHRLLRDHAEYMASPSGTMDSVRVRRLMSLYRRIENENVVIEFDPEIPPSPGIKQGGFAYRPRLDSDGDLIIRVNEHTNLTPQGRQIFTLPEEEKRRFGGLS